MDSSKVQTRYEGSKINDKKAISNETRVANASSSRTSNGTVASVLTYHVCHEFEGKCFPIDQITESVLATYPRAGSNRLSSFGSCQKSSAAV